MNYPALDNSLIKIKNTSKHNPEVSLIILTWNSARYIGRCIASYSKSFLKQRITAEFIVVDNGSTDDTIAVVEHEISGTLPDCCEIFLIRCAENLGTTASRNKGLAIARGSYLVICDSDTEFSHGSWHEVFRFINKDKRVGIVAPALFYADGTIQNSVKKFPTLIDKLNKIPGILLKGNVKTTDFYEDFPWKSIHKVDTAISACWITSRHVLDAVGYLDEKIFYSPEDLDYCLRVWTKGMKVIYFPLMKVIHHTQQITHKKPFSKQSMSHLMGLLYYFYKHKYILSRKGLYKRLYN